MKLSVIIPVLNEAENLPQLLTALNHCEVIVVDGGSDDGSCQLVQDAGFTLINSKPGRARQMNAGATAASGDTLLFLHADTQLPSDGLDALCAALVDEKYVWGRFDVEITGRPLMLKVIAMLMNWRSRLTGIATGDQAMFVRRQVFERLGGFPEQPLMEDIELSKRLLAVSRPACLHQRVNTSGRRWESRGVWRTIWLMWRLRWLYWRGVSPDVLADRYR